MDNQLDPRTNAPFGSYTEDEIKESAIKNQAVDVWSGLGIPGVPSAKEAPFAIRSILFDEDKTQEPLKKNLFEVMKHEWDTSVALADAYSFADRIQSGQDQELLGQGLELYKKAKDMRAQLPPQDEGISYIREMARGASAMSSQMLDVTSKAAPDIAQHGVEGAAVGTAVGAMASGVGAIPGATSGFVVGLANGAKIEVMKQFYVQSKGEIFFNLVDPDQKEPIPVEIALPISKEVGALSAAAETLGLSGAFKAAGLGASIAKRITGIATEGGTEASQQVMEQYARYLADKKLAEFRNAPFEKTFDDYLDMSEARSAARGAIMSAAGLSVPGSAYRGIVKSPELVDRMYEKVYGEQVAKHAESQIQAEVAREQEVEAKAETPLQDMVDPATNTLVEGAPLSSSELTEAAKQAIVKGTTITDSHLDDLTVSPEENVDTLLEEVERNLEQSFNDKTANFLSAVYDHYSLDEAELAERLVESRAQSMGMSTSEYVSHRGLEFDSINAESVDREAFVQFTDDNRTIIHAFKNSNIVDFVHEIGHVFRRDLTGNDAKIVDSYVGSVDGKWTEIEEEKFAKAWEGYVSEGKAPVKELDGVFKRLANWFSKVYKTLRSSSLDVEITPELRGVFDRMLTENVMREEQAMEGKPTKAEATPENIEGLGSVEDLLSALTDKIATDIKATRQKAEEVGVIYGEEFAKMHEGEILFQERKKPIRHKERLEDTDEADDERAITLQEYTDKATKEYGREVGGLKRKKDLSKRELNRLQKHALVNAMKKMFDAGDKHGYKMAKAALKAYLTRSYARSKMQKKHKALRESFLRKLSLGKAYSQGGRRYVKMDPKVATFLRTVDGLLKDARTLKGANALFDKVYAGFATNQYISPEQVLAFRYLQAAVKRTPGTVQEMKVLNSELSNLIKGARDKSPAFMRRAKLEETIPIYLKEVRGEEGSMAEQHKDTTTEAPRLREEREKDVSIFKDWKQAVKLSTRGQYLFGSLTSNIRNIAAYSGAATPLLYKAFDFFKAKQRKMTEIRNAQDTIMQKYAEVYGLASKDGGAIGRTKAEYKTFEQWKRDTTRDIDIGLKGKYSRSELRYVHMIGKDSTLTNRLVNMGFTAEKLALVDSILTEQDKAFADWMIGFFNSDSTYGPINNTYKSIYGVDLGRRGYYVPVRADQFVPDIDGFNSIEADSFATDLRVAQFQMDNMLRSSDSRKTPTSSGRLKQRSDRVDKIPLSIMGDVSLYSSFVTEMAHFKAYAEQAQTAAAILNDKRMRRAVTIEYGGKILKNIDEQLKSVMSDGANTREQYGRIDAIRNAWVFSSVSAAGSVFCKQLISTVQYWENMPLDKFIGYTMEGLLKPSSLKVFLESDYLKNRVAHIDRDLQDASALKEHTAFRLNPTITNFLSLNIRLGDSLAIAIGGYSLYRYYTKDLSMSHEDAIMEVARISETTQQSGMVQELTRIQTGGSFAKFFSVYSSAPVQAARKEIQAVRDYAAGKINEKQLAKTIFIYHIMVPGIFAGVAQLLQGGDDDDDGAAMKSMAVSIALGPFGAAYALGELITYAVSSIVGAETYAPSGMSSDLVDNMLKASKEIVGDKEMTLDDFAKASESVLTLMGVGVPVKRFTRFGENVVDGAPVRAVLGQKAVEEE